MINIIRKELSLEESLKKLSLSLNLVKPNQLLLTVKLGNFMVKYYIGDVL